MSTWEVHQADCLEYMRGMAAGSVDAVIADPPYGTTACKWDSVIPFAPMWEQVKRIVKPRAAIVLFGSQPYTSALVMSNPAMFKYTWVWNKNNAAGFATVKYRPFIVSEDICLFGDGAVTYHPQMETRPTPIRGANRAPSDHYPGLNLTAPKWYAERYPQNIINITKVNHAGQHPAEKPVALMEYLVRTYTNEGDTVLDFTCGSGTTGVACVNTGRAFVGIEKEASYVEIARRRIADAAAQPRLTGVA